MGAQSFALNEYNIFKKRLTFALIGCIIRTVKDTNTQHGGTKL
nr:MAG TPA: hypothetical protein [Caudoviricetes sp.]